MSILLDALKRSESQRELGTVPTLQTSTEMPSREGAQAPNWPTASLALLAAALITWFGLQQFQVPEAVRGASVAEQPADSSGITVNESSGQIVAEQPAATEKSILPRLAGTEVPGPDTAGTEQVRPDDRPKVGQDLRHYVAPEQEAAAPVDEVSREYADRQTELPKVEVAVREPGSPEPSTTAKEAYEPDIINYWQVPEAMREGLPDLRISVLVFAEQPENRFVLINGERLREGEEMSNGLLLEEVRRDRAIFMYRKYRFYLKS